MEDAPVFIVMVKKARSIIDQAGPECERDESQLFIGLKNATSCTATARDQPISLTSP